MERQGRAPHLLVLYRSRVLVVLQTRLASGNPGVFSSFGGRVSPLARFYYHRVGEGLVVLVIEGWEMGGETNGLDASALLQGGCNLDVKEGTNALGEKEVISPPYTSSSDSVAFLLTNCIV